VLGQEYPYLNVIGALMYLANNTRLDIAFVVNCLVRHSAAPTMHHWNDIKNILRYLVGTIELGLYFQKNQDSKLIGYQMLDVYQILLMPGHNQVTCSYTVEQLFLGSHVNKL
jgi:hypothetical protein